MCIQESAIDDFGTLAAGAPSTVLGGEDVRFDVSCVIAGSLKTTSSISMTSRPQVIVAEQTIPIIEAVSAPSQAEDDHFRGEKVSRHCSHRHTIRNMSST